jgi:hypothetical protein
MTKIIERFLEGGRTNGIYTLCAGIPLVAGGVLAMAKIVYLPYWDTNPILGFFCGMSILFVILCGIGGIVLGSVWIKRN